MSKLTRLAAALVLAGVVVGCSTTPVLVNYKPASNVAPFPAAAGYVPAATFIDDRGEPPRWLGAIRGGFGNPLKVLETDEPVAKMVQTAFSEGLRARGASGQAAARRYEIRGTIKRLDCNQVARREAHGVVEVVVVELATGKEKFKRVYSADLVEGSLVSLNVGVFASVDDLRKVAEQVVQQIVDKALDDPDLRSSISS